MQDTDWRSSSLFPESDREWGVNEGGTVRRISEEEVQRYVKKVSSQMGVGGPLLSTPAATNCLPAIRIPALQEPILSAVASKLRMLAWIALVISLLALSLALSRNADASVLLRTAALSALVAGYWFFGFWMARHQRAVYLDWNIFLDWQRRFAGANLTIPMAVILGFALLQVLFWLSGHGRDELFHRAGVVFSSVDQHEYWRFLVGPFLHADVGHAVLNILFSLFVLPYLTPYRPRWVVLLLGYVAIVLSGVAVYVQYKAGLGPSSDGFAGVSALIFFACGFAIANVVTNSRWYPRRHATWLSVSTLILLASPHIVDGETSLTAHATGLLVGTASGLFFRPDARRSDEKP